MAASVITNQASCSFSQETISFKASCESRGSRYYSGLRCPDFQLDVSSFSVNKMSKSLSISCKKKFCLRRVSLPISCVIHGEEFIDGSDDKNKTDSKSWNNIHGSSPSSNAGRKVEKSVLLSLIEEVEPLDMSAISKDASVNTIDAMKRTISGMLGLLPSDQFSVSVKTEKEPLSKLLVSAMMTGFTLRNAEYRLSLQQTLDMPDRVGPSSSAKGGSLKAERRKRSSNSRPDEVEGSFDAGMSRPGCSSEKPSYDQDSLGELSPEALAYIQLLQSQLDSYSEELSICKKKLADLEFNVVVADEDNDLLDYLRSLDSDKVAELSRPTSPEMEDVVQQVIDNLLARMWAGDATLGSGFTSSSARSQAYPVPWKQQQQQQQHSMKTNAGGSPLQFQSTVTANRDYLARLLFWCMLLGHYMRGLEYRLELSRTFSLSPW